MPRLATLLPGLALLLALPLAGCLDTGSRPPVVCVDVERILTQSKAAGQANDHVQKVQDVLQKGLAAYQEELKKHPEEKRQQELRQGLALLQRQLDVERAAARNVVSQHMLAQIASWRAQKGEAIVIARQNVLDAPDSVDITADILRLMDAGSVTFAELPTVTIRSQTPDQAAQSGTAEKSGDKPAPK